MCRLLIIPDAIAAQLVTFDEVIDCIESAFSELDGGLSTLLDVVRGHAATDADSIGIKAASCAAQGFFGMKVGTYFPRLRERGMPAHGSTTFLFDSDNGRPIAAVGANTLNGMRTSAANALATRFLARPDANTLGVVGNGHQAVFEARAVAAVRPITRILFWAPTSKHADAFARSVRGHTGIRAEASDLQTVCARADVLVTVTPSRVALVEKSWIRPGTHIAAMGADADGKQELDPELVAASKVYVDVPAQARTIGECQHAWRLGLLDAAQIEHRTLGRLVNGKAAGREHADEITIFDSSGMALQDLMVAHRVYQRALHRNDLTSVSLF
jgi:ornithine cyclodeaminase/alanine dehydrogenase-like protein (mu-crystallin family)